MAERSAPAQPDLQEKPGPRLVSNTPNPPPKPPTTGNLGPELVSPSLEAERPMQASVPKPVSITPEATRLAAVALAGVNNDVDPTTALEEIVKVHDSQQELADPTQRESTATNVIPFPAKSRRPHLPEVRHHFAAGNADIPQPTDSGEGRPESTQIPEYSKRDAARHMVRSDMETKGTVLPPEHPFAQLVKKVSDRLGIPRDTEILVLDSEETEAFFALVADSVVLSRGYFRELTDRGLEVTEDHIAAVLAHEFAHAQVYGGQTDLPDDYRSRAKRRLTHAEEYRADAKSLEIMSKAGYNPRASIEEFGTLPLTLGRYDLGHPEIIDRIRKLEDRLADDEHPLSHTTKELTPLDPDMQAWIRTDSDIYKKTDALLDLSPSQLKETLLATQALPEFMDTLTLQQHADRISHARGLINTHGDKVNQLAMKIMLLEALGRSEFFVNGQIVGRDSIYLGDNHKTLQDVTSEAFSAKNSRVSFNETQSLRSLFRDHKIQPILLARAYRDRIQPGAVPDPLLDTATGKLADATGMIDNAITMMFERLGKRTYGQSQEIVDNLKNLYENGSISEDLFLTVFGALDETTSRQYQEEAARKRAESVFRTPGESSGIVVNLRTEEGRQQVFEQMKLAVAMSLIDKQRPSADVSSHLQTIISQQTHTAANESRVLAETIANDTTSEAWIQYLRGVDQNELPQLIRAASHIQHAGHEIIFSPRRKAHTSLLHSLSLDPQRRYGAMIKSITDPFPHNEDATVFPHPTKELLKRGYPDASTSTHASKINLSLDEWSSIAEGGYGAGRRDVWALWEYARRVRSGETLEPEFIKVVKTMQNDRASTEMSAADLLAIIQNSPWDDVTTLQRLQWGIAVLFADRNTYIPGTQKDLSATVALLEEIYSRYPNEVFQQVNSDYQISQILPGRSFNRRAISSGILTNVFEKRWAEASKETKDSLQYNEIFVDTIMEVSSRGINFSQEQFDPSVQSAMGRLTDDNLQTLIDFYNTKPALSPDEKRLLVQFHLLAATDHPNRQKIASKLEEDVSFKAIEANHEEQAMQWVLTTLPSCPERDLAITAIIDYAPENLRRQFIREAKGNFYGSSDLLGARRSSRFYPQSLEDAPDETRALVRGAGKVAENYGDLLTRRHSFATLSSTSEEQYNYHTLRQAKREREFRTRVMSGSNYQGLEARLLTEAEPAIFAPEIPLSDRLGKMQDIVPYPSVVRDVHLELVLRDALHGTSTDQETIDIIDSVLPLLTENSSLKTPFATAALRAEIRINPALSDNYETFRDGILKRLPGHSLARNHFLSILENSTNVTPEQLKEIIGLRVSPEGQTSETDDAPMTFVVNKLGELNRAEKTTTLLWISGINSEKSTSIINIEKEYDGHLDSLPKAFIASTPDEKEVFFKRMFLGAEGILDLETVPPAERAQAEQLRQTFINTLSQTMLPDNMPQADLFRSLFRTVIEESDPAHASQTITKLLNKFTEAKLAGQDLPPEEVIALGLNQLGIVGKKVSQSLGEMNWVPDNYKRVFRKAQSEGDVVPKRALLTLAEDAGLTDGSQGIKILSFDKLLGAASNKQACLVTVDVTDESLGIPLETNELVAKAKRPSAQKIHNIEHDLGILTKIVEDLRVKGYTGILPSDFVEEIHESVMKELNFEEERAFSSKLKLDVQERNHHRRTQFDIPTIAFTSDDLMLETKAPGISLREFRDMRTGERQNGLTAEYAAVPEQRVNQAITAELLAQIIATGNANKDMHPGNIFVDTNGNITLIDHGMNEQLSREARLSAASLIFSLISGNRNTLRSALQKFGMDIHGIPINAEAFKFRDNVEELLRIVQTQTSPSELKSVILAASKVNAYTTDMNATDAIGLGKFLIQTVDKHDLPRLLMQTGGLFPDRLPGTP